ncbi:MAG: C10 family peptidase [Saprospiraceae bacterium]|nr:C10 family peptidase [Candidatus Opimibacter skivensis]
MQISIRIILNTLLLLGDISLLEGQIGPLMGTKWKQDFPFNSLAPTLCGESNMNCGQSLAGCGAIALAQVLYYYQYPEAVIAPTSTFGIIGYVYRRKNEGGLYYTLIEDLNSREFIWECQETSNSEILEAVYIAGVSIHSKFDFDVIQGRKWVLAIIYLIWSLRLKKFMIITMCTKLKNVMKVLDVVRMDFPV